MTYIHVLVKNYLIINYIYRIQNYKYYSVFPIYLTMHIYRNLNCITPNFCVKFCIKILQVIGLRMFVNYCVITSIFKLITATVNLTKRAD